MTTTRTQVGIVGAGPSSTAAMTSLAENYAG
jgi:hypothetical protein